MMDPWYTQRESAAGESRWWGDRLPLWSRRIEIFPGGLVIRPTSGALALIWVEPRNTTFVP